MSMTPNSESQLPRINLHPEQGKPWPAPLIPTSPRPPSAEPAPVPGSAPKGRSSAPLVMAVALLALAGGGAFVVHRALHRSEALQDAATEPSAIPIVKVVAVKHTAPEQTLTLPGSTLADQQTPLYARVNGYLKSFAFDLGDTVKKGQLVAEIDSPEVDQQLRQARATLGVAQAALLQAQANQELAKVASDRWAGLVKEKAVSQQEADEKRLTLAAREADVEAARAAIKAQEANVKRLEELSSFKQILAPFDGVITARNVEIGTLVSEGSPTGARELFLMVQERTLRLHVMVPEPFAPSIHEGMEAPLAFGAWPGSTFTGKVSRMSGAIDPASRTRLVELLVPNADGRLLPGMYAQVTFSLHRQGQPLLMPSNALLIRPEGTLVALVRKDGAVHYQKVQVGRDFGTEIEIVSGLEEGDTVMSNPGTVIREGQKVEPQSEKGSR
ncbi:MAG TPA: efflux RND transporter periplasmic adaptor subunit [Planctomycetota bacterium]|nr:efflux RND transporter periplasmic adaptor subunit [Planctomycetota bacterium]